MTADPASRLPEPFTSRTDWRLARALSEPTLSHDRAMATISHAFGGACVAGLLERIDDVAGRCSASRTRACSHRRTRSPT